MPLLVEDAPVVEDVGEELVLSVVAPSDVGEEDYFVSVDAVIPV